MYAGTEAVFMTYYDLHLICRLGLWPTMIYSSYIGLIYSVYMDRFVYDLRWYKRYNVWCGVHITHVWWRLMHIIVQRYMGYCGIAQRNWGTEANVLQKGHGCLSKWGACTHTHTLRTLTWKMTIIYENGPYKCVRVLPLVEAVKHNMAEKACLSVWNMVNGPEQCQSLGLAWAITSRSNTHIHIPGNFIPCGRCTF